MAYIISPMCDISCSLLDISILGKIWSCYVHQIEVTFCHECVTGYR